MAVWAVSFEHLEYAVRKKLDLSADAAIQGFNVSVEEHTYKVNAKMIALAESYLRGDVENKLVLYVEPDRMNERLSIQQGLFLLPCDLKASFEDNLAASFDASPKIFQQPVEMHYSVKDQKLIYELCNPEEVEVIKIIIPRRSIRAALSDLRDMNFTSGTLFPGLDGFARSLHYYSRRVMPDFMEDHETIG